MLTDIQFLAVCLSAVLAAIGVVACAILATMREDVERASWAAFRIASSLDRIANAATVIEEAINNKPPSIVNTLTDILDTLKRGEL